MSTEEGLCRCHPKSIFESGVSSTEGSYLEVNVGCSLQKAKVYCLATTWTALLKLISASDLLQHLNLLEVGIVAVVYVDRIPEARQML